MCKANHFLAYPDAPASGVVYTCDRLTGMWSQAEPAAGQAMDLHCAACPPLPALLRGLASGSQVPGTTLIASARSDGALSLSCAAPFHWLPRDEALYQCDNATGVWPDVTQRSCTACIMPSLGACVEAASSNTLRCQVAGPLPPACVRYLMCSSTWLTSVMSVLAGWVLPHRW